METVTLKVGAIIADVPRSAGWSGPVDPDIARRLREDGMLETSPSAAVTPPPISPTDEPSAD